jgi:hypothetical protein
MLGPTSFGFESWSPVIGGIPPGMGCPIGIPPCIGVPIGTPGMGVPGIGCPGVVWDTMYGWPTGYGVPTGYDGLP